jgi:hypothetical protein
VLLWGLVNRKIFWNDIKKDEDLLQVPEAVTYCLEQTQVYWGEI